MSNGNEFNKYATKHLGISSLNMHRFDSVFTNSLTPYIIEERQLNVASMDVFSRLMMDRIIFLGTPIDDYIANIVQAQLLFLESADPSKDIQIYFNTPGGSVHAGLGILRYHANHFSGYCNYLYRNGGFYGSSFAYCRYSWETLCTQTFKGDDSSANGWRIRTSF